MEVDGQRHAPAALTPNNKPGITRTRGWVGLTAGLDGCGKSSLHPDVLVRNTRWFKYDRD